MAKSIFDTIADDTTTTAPKATKAKTAPKATKAKTAPKATKATKAKAAPKAKTAPKATKAKTAPKATKAKTATKSTPALQVARYHEELSAALGGRSFMYIDLALAVHGADEHKMRVDDYIATTNISYPRANFISNKLVELGYAERPERGVVKLTKTGISLLNDFNTKCSKALS